MDNYEDDFYDIIARISNTNAPIVFKGGLITKLILHENNYHNISRYTIDIDADWIDSMPDMTDIEKQLNDSLQNGEKPYRAVVTRAPDVKKSVGIEIINAKTDTSFVTMDMDIKPLYGERTYHYGELKIKGITPTAIIADKISSISSDLVYKYRAKDLIDLYALTHCVTVSTQDIENARINNGREFQSFDGFLHKTTETKHAYDKLKRINGKPDFDDVHKHLSKFLAPFITKSTEKLIWTPETMSWEMEKEKSSAPRRGPSQLGNTSQILNPPSDSTELPEISNPFNQ